MRILAVGDPHAQESNLDDTDRLFSFVEQLASEHKVDQIHFFGDLYNDHGVSKAVVQEQVHKQLSKLAKLVPICLNNGNHDSTSDMRYSCLTVHSAIQKLTVALQPTMATEFLGILPYYKHSKDFLAAVDEIKANNPKMTTIFCHQDWQGAEYENGFYAPGGTDPAEIQHRDLIAYSGHIHKGSKLGAVRLIGAPRWLTKSDSGQDRGVWLLEFSDKGKIQKETFFSTKDVCGVHRSVNLTAGFTELPEFKNNDKVWVTGKDLTEVEIEKLKKTYKNSVIRHESTKATETLTTVSETVGVAASLRAIADAYLQENQHISSDNLFTELKNRMEYDI